MRRAYLLNRAIALPSDYERMELTRDRRSSDLYLFDYSYCDRARTEVCLDTLAKVRARGELEDFATKTLILCCKGLHPGGPELLRLAREFRSHHLFCELWNIPSELTLLADASIDHLYFLPVSAALDTPVAPAPGAAPNANVFVSLGGDDDIELLLEVVERCPQLHFFVPERAWDKRKGTFDLFEVPIRGPHVTRVKTKKNGRDKPSFTREYRKAFAACDTVLIATRPLPDQPMRGGIRVADALRQGKHLVMVENPMCEALMAQHERTALVTPPDPAAVAAALERICSGRFQVGREYAGIARLTDDESKLAWMIESATDPQVRDRDLFARSPEQVRAGLARTGCSTTFHGLCVGDTLTTYVVRRIAPDRDECHRIELSTPAGDSLALFVSERPLEPYYCRTRRGNWLRYHGTALRPDAEAVIARVADLV